MKYETVEAGGCAPPVQASLTTADKLRECLRGERDWEQMDMARECLEALEQAYAEGYSDACEGQGV